MLKLQIVIASTRPGRAGLPIGRWFHQVAVRANVFDVDLVDLVEMSLPLLDEPAHPRLRKYQHEHTKRWSERVESADAFVFVTPEYNFAAAPSLMNALDFLYHEWTYKPAALVSYGGMSGGVRSAQMLKQVLTSLKIMPIPEAVALTFFSKQMNAAGEFEGNEGNEKAATDMLHELSRWADALKPMRAKK